VLTTADKIIMGHAEDDFRPGDEVAAARAQEAEAANAGTTTAVTARVA